MKQYGRLKRCRRSFSAADILALPSLEDSSFASDRLRFLPDDSASAIVPRKWTDHVAGDAIRRTLVCCPLAAPGSAGCTALGVFQTEACHVIRRSTQAVAGGTSAWSGVPVVASTADSTTPQPCRWRPPASRRSHSSRHVPCTVVANARRGAAAPRRRCQARVGLRGGRGNSGGGRCPVISVVCREQQPALGLWRPSAIHHTTRASRRSASHAQGRPRGAACPLGT